MAAGLATVTLAPVALAIVGLSIAGAPLILVSLGVGIAAQMVWGAFGGGEWAEDAAKRAFGQ